MVCVCVCIYAAKGIKGELKSQYTFMYTPIPEILL